MNKYDLAIIGAGPGGYFAAIIAARYGLSVVLIEKEDAGGLCLNWGCIPSKILLKKAALISGMRKLREKNLIRGYWQVNFPELIAHSRERVEFLRKGLENLIVSNKINLIAGSASFVAGKKLNVTPKDGENFSIEAQNIIIATGAKPKSLPGLPIDGKKIITGKEALSLSRRPASITIVGGGVIGCEFATFFSALGVKKVAIVEYMPRLLPYPNIDNDISEILARSFKSRGIDIRLSCKIIGLAAGSDRVFLDTEVGDRIESELVLVAVGNMANTEKLGLENANVETDKFGFIPVDPRTFRTNSENVYAIGDVASLLGIARPALAHIASAEGELVAEFISKGKTNWTINYDAIPLTIFTDPEIAVCGLTKEEADKRFPEFPEKIVTQSVSENYLGIARALEETDGLDKLVVDLTSFGKILGAQIIGPYAAERIHVWTEAIRAGESAYLMSHQIMAHPTFSEIFREVLLSMDGTAVHVPLAKQIGKKNK